MRKNFETMMMMKIAYDVDVLSNVVSFILMSMNIDRLDENVRDPFSICEKRKRKKLRFVMIDGMTDF